MTQNEKEFEMLKQPLVPDENVRPVDAEDTKESPTCCSPEEEIASKDQIYGAAWAGGISGLLVGGPIGAIVLAYAGVHFAKKNTGDVGNFCRKAGDFVCRLKTEVPKAWREAHPTNPNDTKTESSNAKH